MTTTAKIDITARDRTKAALSSVEKGLNRVKTGVVAVTAGVTAITAATGALVASSLRTGDALAKTADKLGVTTEALAGMRLAAERTAGVTSKTLDMALQRMVRRTSEAAAGTGEAKDAIKELGLSARDLATQSPDEQFNTIADAMQGVTNQADRVRLSFKLFDSEGVALVNTLAQGSEGMAQFQAEAEGLGLALSRVDAGRMEAANDAMGRAGDAVQGIGNQITMGLVAPLEVAANEFTRLASDTQFWESVTKTAVENIWNGLTRIVDVVNLVGFAYNGMQAAAVRGMTALVEATISGLETIGNAFEIVGLDSFAAPFRSAEAALDTYLLSLQSTLPQLEEAMLEHAEFGLEWAETQKRIDRDLAESANASVESRIEGMRKLPNVMAKINKDMAALVKKEAAAEAKANRLKVNTLASYTNSAISLADTLFKDNKAVRMGLIVADTAAAITKALAIYGPTPQGFAAAAAAGATGAAQLAAARSAQKGGGSVASGGGGGSFGGAGPSPVFSDTPVAAPTAASNVAISLTGGLYSRDDIKSLIEAINEEMADGTNLVLT